MNRGGSPTERTTGVIVPFRCPAITLASHARPMRSTATRHYRNQPSSDALSCYLEEIGTYPLLSLDEERALSERIRNGDTDAMAQLECANLRFVVSIAKRFQHRGVHSRT